ncbi:MAG TPA: hypothetical protein VKA55_01045 [Gammaproteobacteria bacterium]|nr:hypothetical protein [Gammaproteobacteria bacterium]
MSPASDVFEPYPQAEAVWSYLEQRFGMDPAAFADHRLWQRAAHKGVWLLHAAAEPATDIKVDWPGLAVLRQPLPRGFPTNAFLRRFGFAATRSCVDVDWDTALRLMYNHQIERDPLDDRGGPYAIRSPFGTLGRGWVRHGRLVLDTPKAWANQLLPRTELAETE